MSRFTARPAHDHTTACWPVCARRGATVVARLADRAPRPTEPAPHPVDVLAAEVADVDTDEDTDPAGSPWQHVHGPRLLAARAQAAQAAATRLRVLRSV